MKIRGILGVEHLFFLAFETHKFYSSNVCPLRPLFNQ
jgi:hypothetical protein